MKILPGIKNYILYRLSTVRQLQLKRDPGNVPGLIAKILHDRTHYAEYKLIRLMRKELMSDQLCIKANMHGATSGGGTQNILVKKLVRKSSISAKDGRILYKLAKFYKPTRIIELGTSVGLSTLYLAFGRRDAKIITVEGNQNLAHIASFMFEKLQLDNIQLMNHTFENALPYLKPEKRDHTLVFIDGDHTYEATIKYFDFFMNTVSESLIIVLHDIYWSDSMKKAWDEIRSYRNVTDAIDLYSLGIILTLMETTN